MKKTTICLTDASGETHFFDLGDLIPQLARVDMLPQGVMKMAITNYVTKVRQMLDEQERFFKAPAGSTERDALLKTCKNLEKEVRAMTNHILPTLNKA